jgi:hypothetical protein
MRTSFLEWWTGREQASYQADGAEILNENGMRRPARWHAGGDFGKIFEVR